MCNAATEVSYRCDKSFELIIICLLTHPKKSCTFFKKETICVHRNNPLILSSNALLHKWYILIFIQEHYHVNILLSFKSTYIHFDERNSSYLDKTFLSSVSKNLTKIAHI